MSQVAQFLWFWTPLSRLERLCLTSFLRTGYDVHVYAYDGLDVPDGVVVKNAEEILPRSAIFTFKRPGFAHGSYAMFADRFRLHLLAARGGWWFDMDFISVKQMPEPKDLLFSSNWEGKGGELALNAAMWCRPGDARMVRLRDECDRILAERGDDLVYAEIGPILLQRFIRENRLEGNVAPWWEFCPYPWRHYYRMAYARKADAVKDRIRLLKHRVWELASHDFRAARIRRGTRAVHLHNEIWKHAGFDKNRVYHPASLVGFYQKKYGLAGA